MRLSTKAAALAMSLYLILGLVGASAYEFGTKVKPGDSDIGKPLFLMPSGITIMVWDTGGVPGYDENDAVYLHTPGATVNANDVRLTPVGSLFKAGTKVTLQDNDIGMPLIAFPGISIGYLDLYGSARYDFDDPVYVHQSVGGASAFVTVLNDVRLTEANGKNPGTQVHNFDSDFNKLLGTGWSSVPVRFFDANGNGEYDYLDNVYLNTPAGVSGIVSVNNVRLSQQIPLDNDESANKGESNEGGTPDKSGSDNTDADDEKSQFGNSDLLGTGAQ